MIRTTRDVESDMGWRAWLVLPVGLLLSLSTQATENDLRAMVVAQGRDAAARQVLLPGGGVAVAWHGDGASRHVRLGFLREGDAVETASQSRVVSVTEGLPGRHDAVDVAATSDQVLVTWETTDLRTHRSDIHLRRYSRSGVALGPAEIVSRVPGANRRPRVAASADGQALVAWGWSDRSWTVGEVHAAFLSTVGHVFPVELSPDEFLSSDAESGAAARALRAFRGGGDLLVSVRGRGQRARAALAVSDGRCVLVRTFHLDALDGVTRWASDGPAFVAAEASEGRVQLGGLALDPAPGDVTRLVVGWRTVGREGETSQLHSRIYESFARACLEVGAGSCCPSWAVSCRSWTSRRGPSWSTGWREWWPFETSVVGLRALRGSGQPG
ncbi:MAG: hypothetical protein AAF533_12200 [Acidobacteriota bacterium]